MSDRNDGLDIAIIGMAGKFPGAENIDEFWELLKNGVEAVTFFTDEELLESGVDPQLLKDPNYIKSRAIIKDEDKFDAQFFDFFPREVEMMDPQHRLFLETAYNALEEAGYDPDRFDGLIGLFGGVSLNTYLYSYLMSQKGFISSAEGYQLSIGNDKDFLTTRVSYKLNLTGPSVDVQTACSTSLVAIHLACQNLLNYNCDMALAGGVSVTVPQKQGYYYQEGMILSKDGHCRAFDHKASGTISGSGVGMVVLKRLEDALEDGDHIYAVIKGSAFNNDGANRVGYTAPSVDGQAEVIANALAVSGVDADTIQYIEAHGTGTVLGDPIEIAALTQVFREQTDKKQFCAIGSVKTNIGHLDAAAGVAGLIKTALSLHHKQIPPSINFEKPNPKIDFENSPFFVNTQLRDWHRQGDVPRRAGISSFGIGGTNVHAVLEEAPHIEASDAAPKDQLLLISAKTPTALDAATRNLGAFLQKNPQANLADVAYTLQVGRKAFNHRRFVVAQSTEDAAQALSSLNPKRILSAAHDKGPDQPPVAFMFSGQGSQYVNMGKELYENEPVFRAEVDRCCELLQPYLKRDLRTLLYPAAGEEESAAEELNQTAFTQPALFVIEYALAKLFMHWGIEPAAMVGHSIGEYVAATLAGVFSLEDALKVVAERGRLMQSMPAGAMLSVRLDEAGVQPYLNEQVTIGALNSPGVTVLSGPFEAIEAVEKQLREKGIGFRRLHTSHAFHSAMMDPILEDFKQVVASVTLNVPQRPYLSNTTGTWITDEQATDPQYYANHLRSAVRFIDNVGELLQDAHTVLLEVGPGTVLSTLARKHPNNTLGRTILSSMRHPNDESGDRAVFLQAIGRLWLSGVDIDWQNAHNGQRRLRVSLPTYPFERKRYWLKASKPITSAASALTGSVQKNPDIAQWFYMPVWKQMQIPRAPGQKFAEDKVWLVLKDQTGLGTQLIEKLKDKAKAVIVLDQSRSFEKKSDTHYAIRPAEYDDFLQVISDLQENDLLPDNILHLWNVLVRSVPLPFETEVKSAYLSLLYLTQALSARHVTKKIQCGIISNNMFNITGYEPIDPALATVHGLSKVIPQEFPNISCRDIDVALPRTLTADLGDLAQRLLLEFTEQERQLGVAYRGKQRWIQEFEPIPLTVKNPTAGYLKENGVYVITGGLGRIGLKLAEYLAQTVKARLALIEPYDFPPQDEWNAYLQTAKEDDVTALKIKRLQGIVESGGQVQVLKADVSDRQALQAALESAQETFGPITGIIHAAGIVGAHAFKAIPEIKEEDWKAQFQAKVYGALNIADILQTLDVDFVLLQSSMSSILGGLGFGAYAPANAVLDALANQQNRLNRAQWICVNWDGWNFDDETFDSGLGSEIAQLAIRPDEGIEAFERIFSYRDLPQIIVSTGDLQARIAKWLKTDIAEAEKQLEEKQAGELHDRPDLPTAYVEPETDLQKQIAGIWQKLLGISRIGIYDDFFDLGGNSLMGTQLISELRAEFQVELPLRSLFEDPTISGVAKIIEAEKEKTQDIPVDEISQMLEQLENLSEEEARKILEEKKKKK